MSVGERSRDEIVDRHRGLAGRALLVSGLTLVSRLLGFAREVLAAALFGDKSAIWDAFLTAWRVPNLFRRLLGEGAVSMSLQTALTEADGAGGNEAGRRLFLRIMGVMVAVLAGASLVGMVGAYAVPDAALGADPEPVRELILRLMPFVVVICLAALATGALNVRGHYLVPSLAPALMNLVWIGTLVWIGVIYVWGDRSPPSGGAALKDYQLDMARVLAWGALLSGLAQLLVQLPALARYGLLRSTSGDAQAADPEDTRRRARGVLKSSLPLAFGAAVYQINVMVDGFMAEAFLRDGGPSAHYLANRVQQFPLALIAIAATGSVWPSLKALGHRGRLDELRALHDKTQLGVCFLMLPASVGLFLLAQPMARGLFEHGSFGPDGVARIAAALRMLAFALLPAGAVGLVSRTYFAMGDFRTPVRVSVVALILNAGLNLVMLVVFEMDVEGLALATAVTTWAQLLWLLPGLAGRLGLPASKAGAVGRLARMALASGVSGAAALGAFGLAPGDLTGLAAAALAGIASYMLVARVLRLAELEEGLQRLREALRRPR